MLKGKKMRKILLTLTFVLGFTNYALADYKLIVPQEPGGGTSVWATIIAPSLAKFLGEPVLVEHIPGAFDIPGFNKWHNELRKDPKTIMVAHGGNAESFLTEKVDYNYGLYEPIALVNLNIAVDKRKDADFSKDKIKFGASSGRRPDVMAMLLMACGNLPDVDHYISCYKDNMVYIPSMQPAEARMATQRGELNTVRETFASQKKFIDPLIASGEYEFWFSHGVLDLKSGKIVADKNFPLDKNFAELFKAKWGVEPKGEFYDAYLLVKNYRDVLQKSLWVDKGNPNAEIIRTAVRAMFQDEATKTALLKDTGDYEWFIGADMVKAYSIIQKEITEKSLKVLVKFNTEAIGLKAIYKPELIQ